MARRPYILEEANWRDVRDGAYRLAILPWGATEAHNLHLPYATDNLQAVHFAREAAARLWEEGRKVMVLPCVPFGVQSAQIDVPFNLNMRPSTQFALLREAGRRRTQCTGQRQQARNPSTVQFRHRDTPLFKSTSCGSVACGPRRPHPLLWGCRPSGTGAPRT